MSLMLYKWSFLVTDKVMKQCMAILRQNGSFYLAEKNPQTDFFPICFQDIYFPFQLLFLL